MLPTDRPSFFLQVSAPAVLHLQDRRVQDLQDAIGVIFPFPTEYCLLHWNRVPIPLSYKYDLSDHFPVLMDMLSRIEANQEGGLHETLASSDLLVELKLAWTIDRLDCAARWVRVRGDLDSLNRTCSSLTTTRQSFLAEWGYLLKKILDCVYKSHVQIEDSSEVDQLSSLHDRIQLNDCEPYLYRWG